MMRYLWLFLMMFFASNAMAAHKDFSFFVDENDRLCIQKGKFLVNLRGYDNEGKLCSGKTQSVRIRVIDAPEDKHTPTDIYLERPFIIVDGINLDPEEKKTLTDLEDQINQVWLPNLLKTLGYTPVLVQFTETVRTSLQENSKVLSQLFVFLNNNKYIPFPGAEEDGFVIMGISQGGVIGRYGAYLYDTHRSPSDAPIRIFSSLDSPHQGAVMPMGLFNTVAFWGDKGGSASASMFKDILLSKGAADLLVYENKCDGNSCSSEVNTKGRFLFEDYRKAAEYKGFPTVLVSQGQLKGVSPAHSNDYYHLSRHVDKLFMTLGSAVSRMHYSENNGTLARNRKKEKTEDAVLEDYKGISKYDFIQGSTYPFAETIYKSLRGGFLDAMPDKMEEDFLLFDLDLNTSWDVDVLTQGWSTFIPTVSAMDMKCNGELAIRSDCGFTQSSAGFPFENPGARSTATATFAVDPTHPRYGEAISGRHIELPFETLNLMPVIYGMRVDMWRILCEVAKYDYDASVGQFRNPKLIGYFSPDTKCMDASKMPDVLGHMGLSKKVSFAYARYDYNKDATEANSSVKFNLPAGWKKVGSWNYGQNVQANTSFEVNVKVENPKGNWMKAELLVCRTKFCSGHLQLNEFDVPVDGKSHTLRWQLPANDGALDGMRWFRLVLNSDGGDVTISDASLLLDTRSEQAVPSKIGSAVVYPNNYEYFPWTDDVHVQSFVDVLGSGLEISYGKARSGMHFEFGKMVSMDDYSNLVVDYWPGTCQNTIAYFDSKKLTEANLDNGSLQNGFVRKILPLSEIIDTDVTPKGSKSAHRLNLQSVYANERCVIKSIMLK